MPTCHHRLLIFGGRLPYSTWILISAPWSIPFTLLCLHPATVHSPSHGYSFCLQSLIIACPLHFAPYGYIICSVRPWYLARLPFQAKDVLNILSLWPPYTRLYLQLDTTFFTLAFAAPALGFVTTVNLFPQSSQISHINLQTMLLSTQYSQLSFMIT